MGKVVGFGDVDQQDQTGHWNGGSPFFKSVEKWFNMNSYLNTIIIGVQIHYYQSYVEILFATEIVFI